MKLIFDRNKEDVEDLVGKTELVEDKNREIKKDETKPTNVLIEGDNLLSLNLLMDEYRSGINLIYIDPPYRTQNKKFKYNDYFKTHDEWLSFMEKRLILAKELLSDDGVIFISIDDNEMAQLKLLCDEIFGEENFQASLTIRMNPKGRQTSRNFAQVHDYILAYSKKVDFKLKGFELNENQIKKQYSQKDIFGVYEERELRKRGASSRQEDRPNLFYPIYYNVENGKIGLNEEGECIKILPKLSDGADGVWRWSKNKLQENIGLLYVRVNRKGRYNVYEKNYYAETKNIKPKTIWDYSDVNTELGTRMLSDILGGKRFDYPKPIGLIERCLMLHNNKDSVVLDFFSGSGTTGHAVLELNKEDGGNRKFILCTNNENNICEEVTYERLNKVINGYTTPKGKEVEGIDGNLKYYKVEEI